MKKKALALLALCSVILCTAPFSALADGMVILPDPYSDRWDYTGETNQDAFISYENGVEKMILSIGLQNSGTAFWIFPLPAGPDKIVIDVINSLPNLSGENVSEKAKSNLLDIKKILQISQLYTIPFMTLYSYNYPAYSMDATGIGIFNKTPGRESDVVVHEHLDKEGLTTEIITAKTASALYDYMKGKGLNINSGEIPVLKNYVGKNYSFVASWISQAPYQSPVPEQGTGMPYYNQDSYYYQASQKGVLVSFPTNRIYYPLLPTSVYGSKAVPATIRVFGFVSPEIFKDIKGYTKVSYFTDNYASLGSGLESFYTGSLSNVKYTKIEMNAPSKLLTDDLWMEKTAPFKAHFGFFVSKNLPALTIVLLALSSIIASALAGLLVFKESRNKKGFIKYSLLGLSNLITIIGFIIAVTFVKTIIVKEEDKELFNELKKRGYKVWPIRTTDLRKLAFIPLFSASFLVISWIFTELIELTV